jgi:hypothetical protein
VTLSLVCSISVSTFTESASAYSVVLTTMLPRTSVTTLLVDASKSARR